MFSKDLISQGAKRVAVLGMPPILCVPSQRTLAGGRFRHCAPDHNQLAQLYNSGLAEELQRLKAKHQGTKLTYIDIYTVLVDMIFHPNNYGEYSCDCNLDCKLTLSFIGELWEISVQGLRYQLKGVAGQGNWSSRCCEIECHRCTKMFQSTSFGTASIPQRELMKSLWTWFSRLIYSTWFNQ